MALSEQTVIIRILLSVILTGLVGMEREKLRRPAGVRTHILVGVGATLIMLTSIYLTEIYGNVQVDRMGSQVISGIGFLGAGTIIRQGNTVQGLTTAAGLWAVACIGLAVGTGFYLAAGTTTFIVLITLIVFKKIETKVMRKNEILDIEITARNRPGQIGDIFKAIEGMKINISSIEFSEEDEKDNEMITIEMALRLQDYEMKNDAINKIISQDGVIKVSKKTGGKF